MLTSFSSAAAFLQEANHAFELNMRLFTSFEKDGDVAASLAPGAAAMPAPSSAQFSKAATYMERRAPGSSTATKTRNAAQDVAVKSKRLVSPWMIFFGVVLPVYLIVRKYAPQYLS